jgi:DNA processing protein
MCFCNGALVTEYPPGIQPEGGNFPACNRIISGLSLGVLVVEAPERSGALITAEHALKQGREVFAIPGSILSSRSAGVNKLIQDGARPVMDVKDILETLHHYSHQSRKGRVQMKPRPPAGTSSLSVALVWYSQPSYLLLPTNMNAPQAFA